MYFEVGFVIVHEQYHRYLMFLLSFYLAFWVPFLETKPKKVLKLILFYILLKSTEAKFSVICEQIMSKLNASCK